MKLKYYIINPGGNITAIVRGGFTKKIKLKIAKNILVSKPSIEQVGFWVNVKNKNSDARLEMAGGEFCGNALRSLGALLAYYKKKNLYLIESSSVKNIIKLKSSTRLSTIALKLNSLKYKNSICGMPGIKHFLSNKKFNKLGAKKILQKNKLLTNKAAGVISYKNIDTSTYLIRPIVYVRDTKTMYEETSCASGTLALSYMLYKNTGIKKLNIIQPSGFKLKTFINKNEIQLSGPIVSIENAIVNF